MMILRLSATMLMRTVISPRRRLRPRLASGFGCAQPGGGFRASHGRGNCLAVSRNSRSRHTRSQHHHYPRGNRKHRRYYVDVLDLGRANELAAAAAHATKKNCNNNPLRGMNDDPIFRNWTSM